MIVVFRPSPNQIEPHSGESDGFRAGHKSCLTICWIERATKGFDQASTPNLAAGNRMPVKVQ